MLICNGASGRRDGGNEGEIESQSQTTTDERCTRQRSVRQGEWDWIRKVVSGGFGVWSNVLLCGPAQVHTQKERVVRPWAGYEEGRGVDRRLTPVTVSAAVHSIWLEQRITQMAGTDHYAVLGVTKTASLSEIKAAHRRLALRLHPDKRGSSGSLRSGQEQSTAAGVAKGVKVSTDASIGERLKSCSMSVLQHRRKIHHQLADNNGEVADANYRRIQLAWECLRDPMRRRQYDEELTRANERAASKVDKAVVVKLSEMECELCEVEVDSTSDGEDVVDGPSDRTSNTDDENEGGSEARQQQQRVYIHTCRCGDDFEILEDELVLVGGGKDNVFECQSCCLLIRVEVDIPFRSVGND